MSTPPVRRPARHPVLPTTGLRTLSWTNVPITAGWSRPARPRDRRRRHGRAGSVPARDLRRRGRRADRAKAGRITLVRVSRAGSGCGHGARSRAGAFGCARTTPTRPATRGGSGDGVAAGQPRGRPEGAACDRPGRTGMCPSSPARWAASTGRCARRRGRASRGDPAGARHVPRVIADVDVSPASDHTRRITRTAATSTTVRPRAAGTTSRTTPGSGSCPTTRHTGS